MKLDDDEARRRLEAGDHAVLATMHPTRGVDVVPVCFSIHGSRLAVPIDRVKPKSTTDLQRRTNLDHDPRATLLVERWDPTDWSKLWWVRAELRRHPPDEADGADALVFEELLRAKYPPYRDATFADLLVFEVTALTGWSASVVP